MKILTGRIGVWLLIFYVMIALPAFSQTKNPVFKTGSWKGMLHRSDGEIIAFNFTAKKENGKLHLYVHNASENLLVDSIRQQGDSVWIQMPFFASGFALRIRDDGNMEGNYIKNYGDRLRMMPFTATFGKAERYASVSKPVYNISGKWEVQFEGDDPLYTAAIGDFTQSPDGKITGTFSTPTGDYRFLEGTVNADSMQLSAFDGGHAMLFTARLLNDSTIADAAMYSGWSDKQTWTARRNDQATLPDGYSITTMRPGETALNFRFLSTDSSLVSINDAQYKGKVVIVQILGSWCPNCMDETAFLSRFYKENRHKGIEVIGLAYERTEDFTESREALQPFLKRFRVEYPFLITGVTVTDDNRTEKTLPQLNNLKAFPTTIFIDKKGKVDKIHTGYDGPATGERYEAFKEEFHNEIDKLLGQ